MKKWLVIAVIFVNLLTFADLNKSDKKSLDSAVKAMEEAEKSSDSKSFFKAFKAAERYLKRLTKKHANDPDVKSAAERLDKLEKLGELEEARKDVETALKNIQKVIERLKQGREKDGSRAQKYMGEMLKLTTQLQQSKEQRFQNTLDDVKRTLNDAKQLNIDVPSLDEIQQEMAFDKAISELNYGQQKNMKSLEKSLTGIIASNNYKIIQRQYDEARDYLKELSDVAENLKIKSLQEKFDNLATRVAMYKLFDEISEQLKDVDSDVIQLHRGVEEIFTYINNDRGEDPLTGSAGFNRTLIALNDCKRDRTSTIENLRKGRAILEKASQDDFSDFQERGKIMGDLDDIIEKWDSVISREGKLIKDLITFVDVETSKVNAEFKRAQEHLSNADQNPKEILEPWHENSRTVSYLKMFLQAFTGISEITEKSKEVVALEEQREKYRKVISELSYIAPAVIEGRSPSSVLEKLKKSAEGEESLTKYLAYYENYGAKWEQANTEIKSLREKMWEKIQAASQKVAEGFDGFKNKYSEVAPNRLEIIQNLESYRGKALKGFTREYLHGGYNGWFLDYGDDRYNYVWDEGTKSALDAISKKHKEVFEEGKSKIISKHGLQGKGSIYWDFSGYKNVDFVALIDGTFQYRVKAQVKNDRGEVVGTVDKGTIQIVQARMVAIRSQYYTYWPGGPNMSDLIDFSDILE